MDGGEGRINSATSILGTFNLNRDCGEIQLLLFALLFGCGCKMLKSSKLDNKLDGCLMSANLARTS